MSKLEEPIEMEQLNINFGLFSVKYKYGICNIWKAKLFN